MFSVTAAGDSFEKQLEAFPESYRPYLNELHNKYPKWSFTPFYTGLDWETVIDNEHDDYALVYNPDAARIFKSLDSDDYDAENDRFYYKDGSFVAASRLAVEYFMDPRNFLDIGGIFQFELLNFNALYTVDMVEAVLSDSFMSESKMKWVNSKGKEYESDTTYAEAIYNAGEKYNINPCFLASKILNEVGSNGSDSVSGTNSEYPGAYNFYNIGATDGAGAVERGLLWALGGTDEKTTYSRPWTTPEKSIMGGAEFLAEEYIAAGQFTGYLQRFNVNPGSDYELYTHQYMSNLTGALSQGYSTYKSYREMDMLDESLSFSIPVFENMSNADGIGRLCGAESTEQYGTVNREYRYVRTGPSVDHDILTTSAGTKVYVAKDKEVEILGKTDTDAYYYEEILTYPYWYRISFTFGSKTYTGYVPASRITPKTTVYTAKGEADIAFTKSKSIKNQLLSSDQSVVKVVDSNTVNFLKNGTASVYIYDSYGFFEEILFKVGNYKSYYPSDMKVTLSGKNATVSSKKHTDAQSYGYSLCDMYGNIVKPDFTTKTSRTFKDLKDGGVYDIFAQNCFGKYIYTKAVQKPVVIKPVKVMNFDFIKDSSLISHLSWDSVSDATGYQIMEYDAETKKYTKVVTVPFGTNSYSLSKKQCEKADNYAVRAYSKYDGIVEYGEWSELISLSSKAPTPSAVNITGKTTSGFTVNWTGNAVCDGYEVYVATPEKPEPYYYKTVTGTSFSVNGFKTLTFRQYKIRSFINTAKGKIYSEFTPLTSTLTLPQSVKNLKLTSTSSTVKAQWDAVADAAYYKLYYKKGTEKYKSVKVEGRTSHTLEKLSGYTDYSVYVTAVAVKNSASSESAAGSTVTVKTKPAVPQKLKVSYQGYNHIDLSWEKNKALDSYKVYYMDSKNKVLGSVETKENSVRINGLASLTAYKFKITGCKNAVSSVIESDFSAVITSKTVIPVVENYRVSDVKEKSFVLSWDKLEGAQQYNLYYKKDGKYVKIMTPETNSCTVTAVPKSSKGYFYLTATFGKGEKAVESEKTKTFTVAVKPAPVTGITVTPTATTVKVSWKKVKNVHGYKIYTYKDGKYTYKKTVKGTSCTLKELESCRYTTVSVRAYVNTSVGTAYGKQVTKSFYTKPYNITEMTQSSKTDTSYTLKWKKPVSGVNRYYLYRYNDENAKFERIAVTSKTSYTVKGLEPGTTQRYTIMAARVKDGKVVTKSERVCDFSCSTHLSKTKNLRLTKATENSLKLNWDKVEGATSYIVYYYNTTQKKFKAYKQTEKTGMTISGLVSGQEYTFRVNAVKETDNETYLGYYSSNLTASTK